MYHRLAEAGNIDAQFKLGIGYILVIMTNKLLLHEPATPMHNSSSVLGTTHNDDYNDCYCHHDCHNDYHPTIMTNTATTIIITVVITTTTT